MKPHSVALLILVASGVSTAGGQEAVPKPVTPVLELRPGEMHYRVGGHRRFVLGRNPVATSSEAFAEHFKHASAAGEMLMRIHFCFMPPDEKAGELHPGMMQSWDAALDAAEKKGLAVLPVLGVWADWNDGSKGEKWHTWDKNPFNSERGGPARSPAELFESGACRALWMKRLEAIVRRWQVRRSIVAWEVFSELDMLTGGSEAKATAFVEEAAKIIRATDRLRRPVTSSLTVGSEWPQLLRSDAVDLVQVHPYGDGPQGDLDVLILKTVRQRLATYGKPVLIGECGLDWRPPRATLDASPRAPVALRHAIWASAVSGAMNGRMFWWQDGYDQFEDADLCRHYQKIALTAFQFVKDVDYGDLTPMECEMSQGLRGAVLGSAAQKPGKGEACLGWFRDARCVAPQWPMERTPGEWVVIPAKEGSWSVEVMETESGAVLDRKETDSKAGRLRIEFGEFRGSIGVRCRRIEKK